MKKIAASALVLLALIGLAGCDLFGSKTEETKEEPKVVKSTVWWVKGSWNGWNADVATRGFFTVSDASASKLYFTLDNLYANTKYEFVVLNTGNIVGENGGEADKLGGGKFDVLSDADRANGTEFTLRTGEDANRKNITFIATKKSYKLELDISTPTAPKLKVVGGTEAALPVTAQVVADKLSFNGWGGVDIRKGTDDKPLAAVVDSTANTVTFKVVVSKDVVNFGFNSLNGYLKGAGQVVGDTFVDVQYDSGDGCTITTPVATSYLAEYDVIVKLPFAAGVFDAPTTKYQVKAVLTKAGTAPLFTVAEVATAAAIRGKTGYFTEITTDFSGNVDAATRSVSGNVITYELTAGTVTDGGFAFVFNDTWYKYGTAVTLGTEYDMINTGMNNTIVTGMTAGSKYLVAITVPVDANQKYDPAGSFKIKVSAKP